MGIRVEVKDSKGKKSYAYELERWDTIHTVLKYIAIKEGQNVDKIGELSLKGDILSQTMPLDQVKLKAGAETIKLELTPTQINSDNFILKDKDDQAVIMFTVNLKRNETSINLKLEKKELTTERVLKELIKTTGPSYITEIYEDNMIMFPKGVTYGPELNNKSIQNLVERKTKASIDCYHEENPINLSIKIVTCFGLKTLHEFVLNMRPHDLIDTLLQKLCEYMSQSDNNKVKNASHTKEKLLIKIKSIKFNAAKQREIRKKLGINYETQWLRNYKLKDNDLIKVFV